MNASGPYIIRYEFLFPNGELREHEVRLDPVTLADTAPLPSPSADWTRLEFRKCDVCPLAATTAFCPLAVRLEGVVQSFSQTISHERALVRVRLPERDVLRETTVQQGVSSLLGVHMVTSGCPVLARLRPMVRFHLPFATRLETIFRAVSTYLVGQYLRGRQGEPADWELRGLVETYQLVGRVNRAFAMRLRAAVAKDAHLNALVQLDLLAKALPESIEEELEDMRFLFPALDVPLG